MEKKVDLRLMMDWARTEFYFDMDSRRRDHDSWTDSLTLNTNLSSWVWSSWLGSEEKTSVELSFILKLRAFLGWFLKSL